MDDRRTTWTFWNQRQSTADLQCEPQSDLASLSSALPGGSRPVLFVAHPDDEVIGAGIYLSKRKGVRVVHVTEGAPQDSQYSQDARAAGFPSREAYALARREESLAALEIAGVPSSAVKCLQFPDQQVSLLMEELTLKLLGLLEEWSPDLVLTHAYEGGHPDHDSVALASHLACRLYQSRWPSSSVRLLEFAGYHGCGGRLNTYEFLPCPERPEYRYHLSPSEQDLKRRMLLAFQTQRRTLESFLPPYWEAFRLAPQYTFSEPPHEGKLYYERFHWGMPSWDSWHALARAVQQKFETWRRDW